MGGETLRLLIEAFACETVLLFGADHAATP